LGLVSLSGCGTCWHGDHQSVTILTTPLDAQTVVGDRVQPLIPGTVSLNRKEVLRRLEWVNEGASSSPTPQQASGIKDLFTCEVVGHTMGARMTTDLVSDALLSGQ
jgi:transposase InsO family protein